MPRCPQVPPFGFKAKLTEEPLQPGDPWVHVHPAGPPPLAFRITPGANRFDPLPKPWDATKVLYAGSNLDVALSEAILRWRDQIAAGAIMLSSKGQLEPRRVSRFTFTRPLSLINATSVGMAAIQRAIDMMPSPASPPGGPALAPPLADDIFLCGADEYFTTQAWGAWFRSQSPTADGIRWVSRQSNTGQCVVLFADRCATNLLQVGSAVPLLQAGSVETLALDRLLQQLGWERD